MMQGSQIFCDSEKRIDARPAIAAARLFSAKTSALGKGCKNYEAAKIKKIS